MILAALAMRPAKWKLLPSAEVWASEKAAAIRGKRSAEVLALVTPMEASQPASRCRHVFAPRDFLKFIAMVDEDRTSLGLGVL